MTREAVHKLVDAIPEGDVERAARLLQLLIAGSDPVLFSLLTAPLDDEPETPEEVAGVAEARAEMARGEGISHEEARRELGV